MAGKTTAYPEPRTAPWGWGRAETPQRWVATEHSLTLTGGERDGYRRKGGLAAAMEQPSYTHGRGGSTRTADRSGYC